MRDKKKNSMCHSSMPFNLLSQSSSSSNEGFLYVSLTICLPVLQYVWHIFNNEIEYEYLLRQSRVPFHCYSVLPWRISFRLLLISYYYHHPISNSVKFSYRCWNIYIYFTKEFSLLISSYDDLIVVIWCRGMTSVGFLYVFYSLNEYNVCDVSTNHRLLCFFNCSLLLKKHEEKRDLTCAMLWGTWILSPSSPL